MVQIFLLLIGFAIARLYPIDALSPDFYNPWITAGGVAASCLLYVLLGAAIARRYVRWYLSGPSDPRPLFASFFRCMILYRLLLLILFAFDCYFLLWPGFVSQDLRMEGIILAEKMVHFLPLPLMLFLSWIPFYRLDCAMRGSDWSRWAYLVFQSRLVLGPVVAVLVLLTLLEDAIEYVRPLARIAARYPALALAFLLLSSFVVFALSPFVLRFVWGVKALPAGPLRERLEALCARARFRARDLLVWDTFGGRFANALVSGVFGRARYVFFTKPLLEGLDPQEMEAVLGHEMGHARHGHLVWYFALFIGLAMFVSGIEGHEAGPLMTIALLIGYWAIVFPYVSRRFERQADLFSLRLLGSAAPLASALDKVCAINGAPRSSGSVTHGSIDSRIRFLVHAEAQPEIAARFERRLRELRGLFVLVILAGLALGMRAALQESPSDPKIERAHDSFARGVDLCERQDFAAAIPQFEEAAQNTPDSWACWYNLGWCARKTRQPALMRRAFAKALSLTPNDPLCRIEMQQALRGDEGKD